MDTGVITEGNGGTNRESRAEFIGNGWWRLSLSIQAINSGGFGVNVGPRLSPTDGLTGYVGDGVSTMAIDCVQLEVGASATSPIINLETRLARQGDTFQLNLAYPGGRWFDPRQGTFFIEWEQCSHSATSQLLGGPAGPAAEILRFVGAVGVTGASQLSSNNGTATLTVTSPGSADITKPITRGALSYSPAGRTISVRGVTATDSNIMFSPVPSSIFLGNASNGIIRDFAWYPMVLTPAQLALLTA
jgi:hypothetical protein